MVVIELNLQTITNKKTIISIDDEEKINKIIDILIDKDLIKKENGIKIINKGKILDLDKKINEYNIQTNDYLIYIVSKKKKKKNNQLETKDNVNTSDNHSVSETNINNNNLIPELESVTNNSINELPATFENININSLREMVMTSAINRIMTNPNVLLNVISGDTRIDSIRNLNNEEFNRILTNPSFLNFNSLMSSMFNIDMNNTELPPLESTNENEEYKLNNQILQ
jgi:hypothetical protein